jgi:hypothetical protein
MSSVHSPVSVAAWRWQLHQLTILGRWSDAAIGERWRATFAPLPEAPPVGATLTFDLLLTEAVPPTPKTEPDFKQGELLAYYLNGPEAIAHFPRYGQLRLNLAEGTTAGTITTAALSTYGVFEDLLAIGLSPHLRRRGMFLLHAFAARPPSPGAGAVLLAGDIGAGKTTTGLALLHAGWQLLSNDSPILARGASGALEVLAYPGLLSAYPDTLTRFPELSALNTTPAVRAKTLFAAEAIYPQVWAESAPPGALVFPQIEPRADHALERLPVPEALRLILPHSIEQWDRAMIPGHLALLTQLMQSVPAYRLRLAPDTDSIPAVLESAARLTRAPS